MPSIIPVPVLSTTDVLYGDRVTSYRWEVLTHSVATGADSLVGVLDGVSDGSLRFGLNQAVKGTGNMTVIDLAAASVTPGLLAISQLSLASVRIRPVQVIQGLPENPLGVFLVSHAGEDWHDTGRIWELELLDRCTVPSQDLVDSSYAVAAGSLILQAVQTLLTSCGEAFALDASNTLTTSGNMVWDAGTSKLTIINDLLDVANYNALWVDGYGNFQATPRVLPANRSLTYDLLGIPRELRDGAAGIYTPDWTRARDNFSVPNKIIAIQAAAGTDTAAIIGTFQNDDPLSPYSTVSRARVIPFVLPSVDCPTDTAPNTLIFLQQRARTTLIAMSAVQAQVDLEHLPIPTRVGDVLRFSSAPAGIDTRHVVTRIELACKPTGLMKSSLQEVISL